jgi:D-alanyl-D-alanine carboxypeptidase (penicillin-binding protein 5/6)
MAAEVYGKVPNESNFHNLPPGQPLEIHHDSSTGARSAANRPATATSVPGEGTGVRIRTAHGSRHRLRHSLERSELLALKSRNRDTIRAGDGRFPVEKVALYAHNPPLGEVRMEMSTAKRWGRTLIATAGLALVGGLSANATTLGDLSRVTARAAIVVDNETDQVLFARNPNTQLPPASTTKLITAVVAMKSGRLDRDVKVSKYASSMQPSKIWLQPGWSMNMRDLVYAMLLRSANDASVVVAEGLAGSVQNFSRRMNTTAKSLGAQRSNFVNPNGLPARGHYSTAADLAAIVRHALTIPEMRQIMSQRTKTIHPRSGSRRDIRLRTTNKLLGKRPYKLIGKTGYTRRAKRCFAGAASLNGREVLVVVLGSNDLWGDLELLVEYGLQPTGPAPDWSRETGWRQALAEPSTAKKPTKTTAAAEPKREPEIIAQGDRGQITSEPSFRFHVQVASLRSKTIAQDLLRRVTGRGYTASLESVDQDGTTLYRVVVREFADRVIARRVARDLSRELHLETQIVAVRG